MFLSFPLILLLLFATCLFSIITIYLARKITLPKYFGRLLLFTLFYIFTTSAYCFIKEIYFPDDLWRERLAPFVLIFGPLLYFGIISLRDNKLPIAIVFIHCIPFFYFFISFLMIKLGLAKVDNNNIAVINRNLSIIAATSFIVYPIVSFFYGRRLFIHRHRDKLIMFIFARIILLFLAVLFLLMGFSPKLGAHPSGIYLLRLIIYSCMLIFVLMIFNFILNRLLNRFSTIDENQSSIRREDEIGKYLKSTLTDHQLSAYQKKLEHAMKADQIFLDIALSLTSLANHLKIPTHHLTQVLSLKTGQTFYQYVNGFRIDYACSILYAEKDVNIEELAENCGFNSKVSFNRQFKKIKGCTPSAYRSKWH